MFYIFYKLEFLSAQITAVIILIIFYYYILIKLLTLLTYNLKQLFNIINNKIVKFI